LQGPRILLIDDDPQDRELVAVVLSRTLPESKIIQSADAASFARSLSKGRLDIVVSEFELGWSDGLSVLAAVRESRPEIPVIMFTGTRDDELAVSAMKAGAVDYLIKSSKGYLRLPEAVSEALEKADIDRRVARSQPWLETLLDRADVGVFRSTLDERLIEANPAFLRLLGVQSIEEALQVDLPEPYFRQSKADLLREMKRDGEIQAREIPLKRMDGSTAWFDLTEILLLDVDGEIVIDGLVQDISHFKQREQEAGKSRDEIERSNADLSQFAYVASHELQEPLRMVERYTELLAEDHKGKLGQEADESIDFILDGTRRMQDLIEELLQFSRISSHGQAFEACDCNTLVSEAIRNLQASIEETQAQVRREGLPTVLGDSSQLGQVFQNLISNALRFRGKESPRVSISAERSEENWVFAVKDNGIGIERADSVRIFEIFRRLNPDYPGTGIGLAISKRVVERHGGRIWLESKVGKGSTFYFTVPVGPVQKSESGEEVGEPEPIKENK